MPSRREERIQTKLPVRVWGVDMNGMPFMQTAHAVDVTRLGARLVDLFCLPEIGEITIQHGNQKARYKIAWTGTLGGAEAGQVGLRLVEPEKNIWGKHLASEMAAGRNDAAAAEAARRHPAPGNGSSSATAVATAVAPVVYTRQRMHPRYSAHATTEVLPDGGLKPVWATLKKISASGFYAETPSPLPVDTRVRVTLRTLVGEIHSDGITRSSHPAVGMGIAFVRLEEPDKLKLQRFIEHVVKSNDVTLGLGTAMIEPVDRVHVPAVTPKLPKKVTPALSPERIAENARLAARLQSLIKELRELQEVVNSADLDHRVTRSFQNSVTHTHQNAEYLAQWLRAANEGKDPYPVIVEINAERVRIAAEQARDLVMDIDSQEIEYSTQGLEKLTQAIATLHKRLTNLLKQ